MWFVSIGVIAMVVGSLFLVRPDIVRKMDNVGKKILMSSEQLISKNKLSAVFFLGSGIALIVVGLLSK